MNENTESKVRIIQACTASAIIAIVVPCLLAAKIAIPDPYWALVGVVALVYDIKATAKLVKNTAKLALYKAQGRKVASK